MRETGKFSFRKPGETERIRRFEKIHWGFQAANGVTAFVIAIFILVTLPGSYGSSTRAGVKGSFTAEQYECHSTQQMQQSCSWRGVFHSNDGRKARPALMTSGPVFKGDTVTAYDVGDADHVYPSRGTDNRFMVNLLFMVFFFVLGTLAFIQGVKSYRRVDANAALWRRLNEPHPWSKELPETEE